MSKYMRAAKSFGAYKSSISEAMNLQDEGAMKARGIEERASRHQKLIGLATEAVVTADKLKGMQETKAKVNEGVGKYEELSGEKVDYNKVTLKDVISGDAKLSDYGKESFKFGDETFTKAEMIAFNEKGMETKFDKMLGIKTEATPKPERERSGWSYDDPYGKKKEKKAVTSKATSQSPDWYDLGEKKVKSTRAEDKVWNVGEDSPNLKLPANTHPDDPNSMWNQINKNVDEVKKNIPTAPERPNVPIESEKVEMIGNQMTEKIELEDFNQWETPRAAPGPSYPGDAMQAALEMENQPNLAKAPPKEYDTQIGKYLGEGLAFDDSLDPSKFSFQLSGQNQETGIDSFSLYDSATGQNFGEMFNVESGTRNVSNINPSLKNASMSWQQLMGDTNFGPVKPRDQLATY